MLNCLFRLLKFALSEAAHFIGQGLILIIGKEQIHNFFAAFNREDKVTFSEPCSHEVFSLVAHIG